MTEQFHYTTPDGRHVTLPYLKNLKVGVIRKLRGQPADEQFFGILEAIADDDTLAVIDDMDAQQFATLMEQWQQQSGVTVGESTASPES